jgi:nucleoside-diphosphate-sugar epimerase
VKALVVGATGAVGRATVRSLAEQGADVVCLSRSGSAPAGRGVKGDVRFPGLGLDAADRALVLGGLTHVVSCAGSVDWRLGPGHARDMHLFGTRNVIDLAASAPAIERVVHVSSVLVFGRTPREVGNRDLEVGQRFRNWYEYGKFLAEREARARDDVPVRSVRLGPVLATGEQLIASAGGGLLAAVPSLVRGYPVHLPEGGRLLSYVSDAATAGEVLARALTDTTSGDVWTYFDEHCWTLAQVMTGLCSAWGVFPRIVRAPAVATVARLVGRRFGAPEGILGYDDLWPRIPREVLGELPADLPPSPEGYIEAAGEALRAAASRLPEAA